MFVYALKALVLHEGSFVLGIFATEAEARAELVKAETLVAHTWIDAFRVERFEVGVSTLMEHVDPPERRVVQAFRHDSPEGVIEQYYRNGAERRVPGARR